jgi:hypothetical protein
MGALGRVEVVPGLVDDLALGNATKPRTPFLLASALKLVDVLRCLQERFLNDIGTVQPGPELARTATTDYQPNKLAISVQERLQSTTLAGAGPLKKLRDGKVFGSHQREL